MALIIQALTVVFVIAIGFGERGRLTRQQKKKSRAQENEAHGHELRH
jgi:hypothetical protein